MLGNAATFAGGPLLGIYTTSPAVVEAGLVRLGIVCRTYAICGMMDVMVGGLRGIGYSVMPMIVSLIGACGLRLLWIATLFQISQFHTMPMLLSLLSCLLDHHVLRPRGVLRVGHETAACAAGRTRFGDDNGLSGQIKRGPHQWCGPLFFIEALLQPQPQPDGQHRAATSKMVSAVCPQRRL